MILVLLFDTQQTREALIKVAVFSSWGMLKLLLD
jgi:hypothetical protein